MNREPAAPAGRDVLGRTAVLISLGLHVGGFLIAFGVPRLLARAPGAHPVYVVDLVSFPGGGAPSPAPAAGAPPPAVAPKPAPPKAAPPPPKKPAEKAIILPDKAAKKPVAKKSAPIVKPEPETKPPEPDQAATESAAAPDPSAKPQATAPTPAAGATAAPGAGGAGESGTGGGGQGTGVGGDEYNFYLGLLDRSIKGAWRRPRYDGQEIYSATVRMQISRTGRVLKLELVQPSGLDLLDRSALKAVRDAEPFPPFPGALTIDTLPVQIVFELNPEGAGAEAPGP